MAEVFHLHAQPALRDASLLLAFEGWSDAGEAASSAARFLGRAVGAAPLAELDPEEFYDFTVNRPRVSAGSGGARRLEWPTLGIEYAAAAGERGLLVGIGPEPHLRWRRFADELAALVRSFSVRRAVLLGSFLADVVYSRPVRVSGSATSAEWLERLALETSGYEGPTGLLSVMGERLRHEGVEVVSLWAGLPHYIEASPNPRGALALVQKASLFLGLPVDDAPLQESAADFEERVSALVASDPALSEYVRSLKKREFAQ